MADIIKPIPEILPGLQTATPATSLERHLVELQRSMVAARHEAWKVLGYVSLDVFLIKEADFTQAIIDAIRNAKGGTLRNALAKVEEMPELPKHGGDRKSERDQVDNINLKVKGGTDTTYTLRRLKRDAPELFEEVKAGRLSANAAAILPTRSR